MKNKKVIILSGFAFGGTNIVWNILQSHPEIVAPPYETGQLFRRTSQSLRRFIDRKWYTSLPFSANALDSILFDYKMESLQGTNSRYRNQNELYTRAQVAQAALCLKSINEDISITDLLLKAYPNLYFIGLVRNGYSLADGYLRRGQTAAEAGHMYCLVADKLKQYAALIPRFKIVTFEDVLSQPFEIAQDLFEFVDVYPRVLPMLRLKAKKVINSEGKHVPTFGSEKQKYWFSRENIDQIIDPGINQKQKDRLSSQAISEFNQTSKSALRFFWLRDA